MCLKFLKKEWDAEAKYREQFRLSSYLWWFNSQMPKKIVKWFMFRKINSKSSKVDSGGMLKPQIE